MKGEKTSFKSKSNEFGIAALKDGERSKILDKMSGCHTCPVRQYCDLFLQKSETDKKYGCKDVRQVHLANLKKYKTPTTELIKLAAEIETRLQYQSIIDGVKLENLSYNAKELLKMKLRIIEIIYKYEKGTKQTINVIHDGFDIKVNKEAYGNFGNNKVVDAPVKEEEETKDGLHDTDEGN